jgi:hypothetical protein
MPSAMTLKGYVFDDGGAGKEDVEIKVFQKNTTSTALATATSGTGGVWTASWNPSDSNTTQVDVQGTLGSSVFRWKYDDRIAVSGAIIGDLRLTPTHKFSFILAGDPASADVTVTLPDASAGAAYTLAGLTVAQTFSAAQTFTSTVTVGSDGSGTDVIFYSGTSGDNLTWDASEEQLIITGTNGTTSLNVADGNVAIADDLAVDGTSNLDNTDIDGTLAVDGATISLDATTSLNIDNSNTSNGVTIGTATSGVPVSIGHATSETTINDNLTVTGTVDIGGGAIDGTAIGASSTSTIVGTTIDATTDFTIGDTVITDGVITDSSGLQLAANLDINGTADISGDLTLSAGADGALQFTNAGENSIKIPDNQASALIVEEADNAYLTFVTTNSSEAVTVSKVLKVSAGIEFPGTQSEISDVNTLDDYEEGTFTPLLGDGSSELSSNYNIQVGEYTKIGNRVFFNIHIRNTDLSGLSAGNQLRIADLPFTAVANVTTGGVVVSGGRAGVAIGAGGSMALDAANQTPAGAVIENTDFINFGVWDATTGLTDMKVSELSDAGVFALSGNYRVAT